MYTIGHGDQQLDSLFSLLREWDIQVLMDVRSVPFSRRHPQFNQSSLEGESLRLGVSYRWVPELGGRPKDPTLLNTDGTPNYVAMSRADEFAFEIPGVVSSARREPTAILCSEGRPEKCHRALLVAPALVNAGCAVRHVLPDGTLLEDVPVPLPLEL